MQDAPNVVDPRQMKELRIQHEKPQEYRAGVMFFETVPPELQAPIKAVRTLSHGQPSSTSTLVLDGEVVKVETTRLPMPELD